MSMTDQMCRDFDNGKCSRGTRCKFLHPKLQICKDFQNKKCDREKCKFLHVTRDEEETYENSGVIPDHLDEKEAKRKRTMPNAFGGGQGFDMYGGGFDDGMYGKRRREDGFGMMGGGLPPPPANGMMAGLSANGLMVENEMLKVKITELQQQIMELRQMNDTLYEQNTGYRNQLRGTVAATSQTANNHTSVGVSDLVSNRNYYDFGTVSR